MPRLRCKTALAVRRAIVTPNHHLLLVVLPTRLVAFAVEANGSLKKCGTTRLDDSFGLSGNDHWEGITDNVGLAVSPNGRTLYMWHNTGFVDHHENSMVVYRLDKLGRVKPISGPLVLVEYNIAGVRFIDRGRRMYVTNYDNGHRTYQIDRRGIPHP